jgi:hypothetical protein
MCCCARDECNALDRAMPTQQYFGDHGLSNAHRRTQRSMLGDAGRNRL